jgi:hypothetical protein
MLNFVQLNTQRLPVRRAADLPRSLSIASSSSPMPPHNADLDLPGIAECIVNRLRFSDRRIDLPLEEQPDPGPRPSRR